MNIVKVSRSPYTLRWYQEEAIKAFNQYVVNGGHSTLISASTGSGKTLIIAEVTKEYAKQGKQVLIVTHRKELIEQNEHTLNLHAKSIKTGVISASCKRKEYDAPVLIGGIQTIIRNMSKIPSIDLLIVDECHHISRDAETSYGKLISQLKEKNQKLLILGLTATPYRMDDGLLYEGENAIFDSCCYDVSISTLMEQGFLCNLVTRGSAQKIDTSNLHTRMGDFDQRELQIVADDEKLTDYVVRDVIEKCADRKHWIIFTTGVKHSSHVCKKLTELGVTNASIDGSMDTETRERIIRDYKSGVIRCIVNCNVLTEGFDFPSIDALILLVSTKSVNKYIQIMGRALRISPEKKDCLVLDYGENVLRLGFITDVKIPTKGEKAEKKDVKECPKCHLYVTRGTKECPDCGYKFVGQPRKLNHKHVAYDGEVVEFKPHWVKVDKVSYGIHHKEGKPDTFRVSYKCADKMVYNKYLSIAHDAHPYAFEQSVKFIQNELRGNALDLNDAILECRSWRVPSEIFVTKTENGFIEIKNLMF